MITYEKAKELKDSGFPQVFEPGDFGYAENNISGVHGWISYDKGEYGLYDGTGEYGIDASGFLKSPSLSELIEACGRINLSGADIEENIWEAQATIVHKLYIEWGLTPETAVANLWLAINRK